MKVIEIPAPIKAKLIGSKDEPKEIPFKEFLELHTDTFSGAKTPKQFRQLAKIAEALDGSKDTFQLEDADYDLLKECLNEGKYLPGVAKQLIPFYDAIEKAQDVKK